ncbi:MAG TPA: ABC transporter ATP-binding protein, partial [Haloplasmataceae bacterium]
ILKLLYKVNFFYLIIILLLNILVGLIPTLNLLITKRLLNVLSTGNIEQIMINVLFLIGIEIISSVISLTNSYFTLIYKKMLSYKIDLLINQKAQELSLANFEDSEVYDILQRAQKDVRYRPYEIFTTILRMLSCSVTLITSVIILVVWKWYAAIILIVVPFISTFRLLRQGQKEYYTEKNRTQEARKAWYYSYLLTNDTNVKEIKLYDLHGFILNKCRNIYDKFFTQDKKLVKTRTFINLGFEIINHIVVAFLILLLVIDVIKQKILIGSFVGYMRAITLTQSNSINILNSIFSLYQNTLYMNNLFEYLAIKQDDLLQEGLYKISDIEEVEFKNVSFKYPKTDRYVLRDVSFKINKNENLAIVGENGSGKTTIIKLLTGLYKLEEGLILINGIDINKIDLYSLHKCIGIVLQDFIKYQLTLRENVGFGNLDNLSDDISIMSALSKAGTETIAQTLPMGLDNQLGTWFDNGQQLSGGQWQKIALARAFMRNARIYILDEPSSSLDPISEKELFTRFIELVKNKMGIFISHRFSTVKYATNIIVLHEGKIIESGNHRELMNLNGHYAHMYNIQKEPFLDESD